jgi:hypothetical protein
MTSFSTERPFPGNRASVLAALALGLGFAALVFLPAYLALSDHPQHVAQQALWLMFRDPAFHTPGRYALNLSTPYSLPAITAHLAALALGAEGGVRLVLWGALVAFVLGASSVLSAYGRPRELALAAVPAALSWSFYWGFFPFVVALPIALFGIAAARRLATGGGRGPAALLVLLSLAAVAAHGFAFLLLAGFGALTAIGAPRAGLPRRLAKVLAALAPATVAFVVWTQAVAGGEGGVVFGATKFRFQHALASVFGAHSGDARVLLLAAAAALLAALVHRSTRAVPLAGDEQGRRDLRWLALAGLAGYAVFPHELGFTWGLYERISPVGWVAFVGAWPVPAAARRRAAWALGFAGLAALSMASAGVQLARASREAAGIRELASALPPRQRILWSPCGDDAGAVVPVPVYRHFAAYYQIDRGGEISRPFARYPHMVVRYAPGAKAIDRQELPHPERYDVFLARAGPLCSLGELVARGPIVVRGRYVALPASAVDEELRARLWKPDGDDQVVKGR